MERRAIIPKVRAFLGRVELDLVQVAGEMADRMEVINIYTPVLELPAGNLEGLVILDGIYPRRSVPLDFEFASSSTVVSINGHDVKSSHEKNIRLSVPPTVPKRNASASYRLRAETSAGNSYTYTFSGLSPDGWQGSIVVDNPPPGQPADPSHRRPDGRNDLNGATGLLLAFVDYLIRGDAEAAYRLCALEYRSIVRLEEFRAAISNYACSLAHETKVHSGADALRPCSVVTESVYVDGPTDESVETVSEQRGFNDFFTVAPTPEGYAILEFHLHRFQRRVDQDGGGLEYPLLI